MADSERTESNEYGSTQVSSFALLLSLLAIALIVLVPPPQSGVSFPAEDDLSGEASNRVADNPPPGLGFVTEDDLSDEAPNEVPDNPPPDIDFAAEDDLSDEAPNEVPDNPPPDTDFAAEDDLSDEAPNEVPDNPPPDTDFAADDDLSSEPIDQVADSSAAGTNNVALEADTNNQKVKLPIHDTAWEIFYGLPLADVDEYFAYLRNKGFSGLWASVLPLGYQNGGGSANSALFARNVAGDRVAEQVGNDVVLTAEHIDHIKAYLDKAQQYGLELNPVVAWANNNVGPNTSGDCAEHSWGPARYPTIFEDNAYAYGVSVAEGFGNHPAIGYWVLGGDDIWSCDSAQLWANMKAGLRTADLGQPTTYHTGGDYNRYRDESWNEFLSPQTGWGQNTDQLGALKATGKVVYAAEMRYYLDTGFTAEQVGAETQVAFDQGVDGMLYGDVRRVHYGMTDNLYKADDVPAVNHIRDTFDSPGEDAFFGVVGSEN